MEQIIRLLEGKEGYVSGEALSEELGISRAAVWKRIKALRCKGFTIKAVPSKGYKLMRSPDLSVDDVSAHLGDFWKNVIFYKIADSTNELAMAAARKKEIVSGTVFIADAQEKGRGRLGRVWVSPPSVNIYMSIVLRPEISPRDATLLTIIAAVACVGALRAESGIDLSIKWPNDIVVGLGKIGGILTEIRSEPERINVAVIGIGINVNVRQEDFPADIRGEATSLRIETGRRFSRSRIIISVLNEIERWYKCLLQEGRRPLLDKWREYSSTLGKEVVIDAAGEKVTGFAEDIDDEGMLILRLTSGQRRVISAGDLTMLRPAATRGSQR